MWSQLTWQMRRRLWDQIVVLKYRGNKPEQIPLPPEDQHPLRSVPLRQIFPSIPIAGISVADRVPEDEARRFNRLFYGFQMGLASVFGPHQAGLPPVSPDGDDNLRAAYGDEKRSLFPAPVLPESFRGTTPDLGQLAVAGPYWGYLEQCEDTRFQWDLRELGGFEHWPGVCSLGVRVIFDRDASGTKLLPTSIECELGSVRPSDPNWKEAIQLALCALTTHVSLVRHFNGIHLAIGAKFAIATRNQLPAGHPLCRLLWPHVYGSQYSNDLVTLGQMSPLGDFPMIFSFTHAGMCALFEHTHRAIRFEAYDPVRDAERRHEVGSGLDTPGYDNLRRIFEVLLGHTTAYIDAYYPSDAALAADTPARRWIDELQQTVPNGVPVASERVTRESLARLVAVFMQTVVVEHELRGTFLWNYQLWTDQQPIRVYRNGEREPIDVFQHLVNANLVLNVKRALLAEDFSYLAIDDRGRELFRAFQKKLVALQAEMNDEPRLLWKIYPDMLNANMNA